MLMAILGISGRMGKQIYELYKDKFDIIGIDLVNHPLVKTYRNLNEVEEKIELLVDFSSSSSLPMLKEALTKGVTVISGTTGYDEKEIETLITNYPYFHWSSNYAKGIEIFTKLVTKCFKEYPLIDFIEIHSSRKKDAPSGTAKMIAKRINFPYEKIQSLRINQTPAVHEIIFTSQNEKIILRHEVLNANAFLEGINQKLEEVLGEKSDSQIV